MLGANGPAAWGGVALTWLLDRFVDLLARLGIGTNLLDG